MTSRCGNEEGRSFPALAKIDPPRSAPISYRAVAADHTGARALPFLPLELCVCRTSTLGGHAQAKEAGSHCRETAIVVIPESGARSRMLQHRAPQFLVSKR